MKNIIPLNKKQIVLIEQNISIIGAVIASRIFVNNDAFGLEYDDLFQEGCLCLCKAALKYDESKKCTFSSFAYIVILNGLMSYCKRMKRKNNNKSNYIEKEKILSEDMIFDDAYITDKILKKDVIQMLESIKNQYSKTSKYGIEALILKIKGYSGADIAKMYGVKPNLIGAWMARALKKLKENAVFILYMEDFKK